MTPAPSFSDALAQLRALIDEAVQSAEGFARGEIDGLVLEDLARQLEDCVHRTRQWAALHAERGDTTARAARGLLDDARDAADHLRSLVAEGPLPQVPQVGPLVLVVDDDDLHRRILVRQLLRLGQRVEEAQDGAATLARVADGGVALVVLDLHLPDIDGLEVARRLRASTTAPTLVAVTGHPHAYTRRDCIRNGIADYLTKPASSGDLAEVLERWLQR
jgi:CheY-like chemotaxis protein